MHYVIRPYYRWPPTEPLQFWGQDLYFWYCFVNGSQFPVCYWTGIRFSTSLSYPFSFCCACLIKPAWLTQTLTHFWTKRHLSNYPCHVTPSDLSCFSFSWGMSHVFSFKNPIYRGHELQNSQVWRTNLLLPRLHRKRALKRDPRDPVVLLDQAHWNPRTAELKLAFFNSV